MDLYLQESANCSYVPVPSINLASASPSQLLSFISDDYLSLALGPSVYFSQSGFWYLVDVLDLLPQYKIHPSPEELKRNRVSKLKCLLIVCRYHIIMTGFSLLLMEYGGEADAATPPNVAIAQWVNTIRYISSYVPSILKVLALDSAKVAGHFNPNTMAFSMLAGKPGCPISPKQALPWEHGLAWLLYHVLAPAFRILINLFVVDTWIYFGHRACHVNRFLYRHIHAQHHQLYVPYAYGAAYGAIGESIFLDTLSYMFANWVSGVTPREAMLFTLWATSKTVYDHCGYEFPNDPMVWLNPNGPRYHDWHHQMPGFRYNYSSYLWVWDDWMGTRAEPWMQKKIIQSSDGSVLTKSDKVTVPVAL